MKIIFHDNDNLKLAEVLSDSVLIHQTQDALDIMADCTYNGYNTIVVYEEAIVPAFFDLKTGIAGDILQKFSTYNVRLAIIGDFSKYTSKSLRDFIYESNRHGHIFFAGSREEAFEKLESVNK